MGMCYDADQDCDEEEDAESEACKNMKECDKFYRKAMGYTREQPIPCEGECDRCEEECEDMDCEPCKKCMNCFENECDNQVERCNENDEDCMGEMICEMMGMLMDEEGSGSGSGSGSNDQAPNFLSKLHAQ